MNCPSYSQLRRCLAAAAVVLFSTAPLAEPAVYYVNDLSTNGDVYCTAVGSDTNNGTSAATPLLTLTNLLAVKDLNGGDTVLIDTGGYTNAVTITAADSGSSGSYVAFQGSTNFAAGGSRLDGGFVEVTALTLDGADYVRLADLTVVGGSYYNLTLSSGSDNNEILHVTFTSAGYVGARNSSGVSNRFQRCLFYNTGSAGGSAFYADVKTGVTWDQCVSWGNAAVFWNPPESVSNSVMVGGVLCKDSSVPAGDYNIVWDVTIQNNSNYDSLVELQKARGDWWHSICANPQFANTSTGDFHSKSTVGRFNPATGTWVTDTVHSVTIDFGSPLCVYTNEPLPNGSNLNAGIWGNTGEASLSRTNAWLLALTCNDGGSVSGAGNPLYWRGGLLTNGTTVKLQYSFDLGASWSNIVTGLPATNGSYAWDVTGLPSTTAFWRVVNESDPSVWDANDQRVSVNGGQVQYFVNDAYTNGDVYCTAPGASTNSGLSPGTPVLGLTNLLGRYGFGGRDIVYVDTGTNTGDQVTITGDDCGSPANGRFTIQGSTNQAQGGTVIDKGSGTGDAMQLGNADYVRIANVNLKRGFYTLELSSGSDQNEFVSVQVWSAAFAGVRNLSGNTNRFYQCSALNNLYGFYVDPSWGIHWDQGLSYGNTYAFYNPSGLSISNSVLMGGTAFYGTVPSNGDYNVFWKLTLHQSVSYATLSDFQKSVGGWWHCTYADPDFASTNTLDFHPKSETGRYNPLTGSWVTDVVHSVLIDFGARQSAYANEPMPNGTNVNAGSFGNTWEASKSRTNVWLLALTYNDGGQLSVPSDAVYWNYGNMGTNARVRIELSRDGGASWEIVVTNIAVSQQSYTWTSTNYLSSLLARWRVVLETDTNVWDGIETNISFRNGPYPYYINDAYTNGDVYCTAPGDDGNTGTSPGSPKATLNALLAAYDLDFDDIVYVDSGTYLLTANPTIGPLDAGSTNGFVHILGSTNSAVGSVFNRQTMAAGAYALYLPVNSDYLDIQNIVFRNAEHGLYVNGAKNVKLTRVVARENLESGVLADNDSSNVWVRQSVIWKNTNAGIRASSAQVLVSNSVVVASGPQAYGYYAGTNTSIIGDYNDLYAESNAVVGYIGTLGHNQDTPVSWAGETGREIHSLGTDPLFANPVLGDFHLRTATPNGRFAPGEGWTNDAETSVLIDSGDPAAAYASEPVPNGNRLNIGLYGNTGEASKGRTNAWLYAAGPRDGGWLKGNGVFHWVAGGPATAHTVRIEYSPDGGVNWSTLTNGQAASAETFSWNTAATNDTPAGLWRVTSLTDSTVLDSAVSFFSIRNAGLKVYANDSETSGDVFCTAPGQTNNWVATTNQPLSSLAQILSLFDLEPGDMVYVDTGNYTNRVNTTGLRRNSGSLATPLRITGSTNEAVGGTVIDRGSTGTNDYGLALYSSKGLSLSNLMFRGGYQGVRMDSVKETTLRWVQSVSNASHGFVVLSSSNITLRHCLSAHNAGGGLYVASAYAAELTQSMLWSNTGGAVFQISGKLAVSNSVLSAAGAGTYLYNIAAGDASVQADCNDLLVANNARAANYKGFVAETVFAWQSDYAKDIRSLSHAPLFADPGARDFHEQSVIVSGRFVVGQGYVTNDLQQSPLIDTGDPLADFSSEPAPNGGRMNVGLYGNTPQASKSRTNGWLLALTCNDGGVMTGSNNVHWVVGGAATGHVVDLQYSTNGLDGWVTFASNLLASSSPHMWDTTLLPAFMPQVYWRVVSTNDTSVWSRTDSSFVINNGFLTFYVNDKNPNGDVYCSTIGSEAYDGLSAATPAVSIDQILSKYSMRVGDTLYVDTGSYTQRTEWIMQYLSGDISNRLVVRGSYNLSAGGSAVYCGGLTNAVNILNSKYVDLSYLNILNAKVGLRVSESTNSVIQWVKTVNCDSGFQVSDAPSNGLSFCTAVGGIYGYEVNTPSLNLSQCAAAGASFGLYIAGAPQNAWFRNGVLWSNTYGVYLAAGSVSIRDSVIGAFGPDRYAYYYVNGGLTSDYNNIYVQGGASAGARQTNTLVIYQTLSRWARDFGADRHSLSHDPLFANAAGGSDFHVKSTAGRYSFAATNYVTNDVVTSVLVDAGDPASVWTNEPEPNGARVNIGMFGNSTQASKTPTNGSVTAVSFNDGGRVEGLADIFWVVRGDATSHLVRLDFSWDGGTGWTNIATGVTASAQSYPWDTVAYPSTPLGVWKITSEQDTNVVDQTDARFAVRNEKLNFYVNDEFTNGDVYCTATGRVWNSGAFPNAPKLSVQDVIDTYDLEPGDTVWVDTGLYSLTGAVTVGQFDSGERTNRVTIFGSTNEPAGGAVLSGHGVSLNGASGFGVSHLTISNALAGVSVYAGTNCLVEWVKAMKCTTGFELGSQANYCDLEHDLALGGNLGVFVSSAQYAKWRNGILWSNTYGVYLPSGGISVQNSVIGAVGPNQYAFFYYQGGLTSDYNTIYLQNGGYAGYRQTLSQPVIYQTVSRWARDFGADKHSLSQDPGFADTAAGDFHPFSQAGRFDWAVTNYATNDVVTSVMVDAGDPGSAWANEPEPNGARVNIGMFGDSAQASKSPTNGSVTAVSFNDGGRVEGVTNVFWVVRGDATGHTVRLDFSWDGGFTWTNIATGVTASAQSYLWDTTLYPSTPAGVWRVWDEIDTGVSDTTDVRFAVRNALLSFYVNDGYTNGDVYCSTTGQVENTGAFTNAPKYSLQDVIDTYDLEPGDTIYVDTGIYDLTATVEIGKFDSGDPTNRVTIRGSTNEAGGGAVLSGAGVYLNGVSGFGLSCLTVSNASTAVRLYQATNCLVEWVRAMKCSTGFELASLADYCELRNNLAVGCSIGLYGLGALYANWCNGVLWSNTYGVNMALGSLSVRNTVIAEFGSGAYAFSYNNGTLTSDYNNIVLEQGAYASYQPQGAIPIINQTVARWARDTGRDQHSLSHDPGFASAASNDFHLLSQRGRYVPGRGWTNDSVTSVLIDAGDPAVVWTNEPWPNGNRANIGLYGASLHASETPTNASLTAITCNDGGRIEGVTNLCWVVRGAATAHTVRLSFSPDGGVYWTNIATNVAASAGFYLWNTTLYTSTIRGVWRLASEVDSGVFGQTRTNFAVRNNPLYFYVNDNSTIDDVYCTGVGLATNSGVSPANPKLSLQELMDTYDLEPGDVVYVDTASFLITVPVTFNRYDCGDSTNAMTIQGSTNEVAGGTIYTKFAGGYAFDVYQTRGVNLRYLAIRNADSGVRFYQSDHGRGEWLRLENNQNGSELFDSDYVQFRHCVVRNSGTRGLWIKQSYNLLWESGVLWSNRTGTYVLDSTIAVENSVIGALARGTFGYLLASGSITADYNSIYVSDGGMAAAVLGGGGGGGTTRYPTVFGWATASGQDTHSLTINPRFANAGGGDFHLQSVGGRYEPGIGFTTNDTLSSVLIDGGWPDSPFSEEPEPNGGRLNIGLYGNTFQESKTPTNGILATVSLHDGGSVSGDVALNWLVTGGATSHTVTISISTNGGLTFINIASGVPATDRTYLWNSTPYGNTSLGRWKVTDDLNTNLFDTTDGDFYLRNSGGLKYYVNDTFTTNDVYTTVSGNATNRGVSPDTPKASVQDVLNTYDLEGGDMVYVDTGNYLLNENTVVGDLDAGSSTNRVVIQGSTNVAAGGTVLDRQGAGASSYAVHLFETAGIALRHLNVRNAGSGVAIEKSPECLLEWVTAEDNGGSGFLVAQYGGQGPAAFRHCMARNNTSAGVAAPAGSLTWESGVLWGNSNAVTMSSGSAEIRNSLLQASGEGGRVFSLGASGVISTSDYNNILVSDGAYVGENARLIGGSDLFDTLTSWVLGYGQDQHSLSHEPFLADPGADFHLQSEAGRYVPGAGWTNDADTSPMIDTGDPLSCFTNETPPNGGRINIGLYGDSGEASHSITNPWVLAISFNDGGVLNGTNDIYWAAGNMSPTDTVALQYSLNGGIEWYTILSNVLADAGSLSWDVSSLSVTIRGRWRVVSETYTNVADGVDENFVIRNEPGTYYINDGVTNGDIYCTAIGQATNTGKSAGSPFDGPITLIQTYPLGPGDVIYIDTGVYTNSDDFTFNALRRGESGMVIRVSGSTNSAYGGSVLCRGSTNVGTYGMLFNSTEYIEVDHLKLADGHVGVGMAESASISLSWIEAYSNLSHGFSVSHSYPVEITHCASWNNGGYGLSVAGDALVYWDQGVLWSNGMGGVYSAGSTLGFSNSAVHAFGSGHYLFYLNQGTLLSDFNVFWPEAPATIAYDGFDAITYSRTVEWQKRATSDWHSILTDPLFADGSVGDFHLQSQEGRYTNGTWVKDSASSWAIDAAGFAMTYTNEPPPNGFRADVGLYGNTAEASLTPTGQPALFAASISDGGTIRGTQHLYWVSHGLPTSSTVRLQYSVDSGVTWTNIASGQSVGQDGYYWNTALFQSTPLGRWRVNSEGDTNIVDVTDVNFFMRIGPVEFYVNDASTNNDVYCTAIGLATNVGLSPSTPKLSIQGIVDAYDVDGGDTIYVDTGLYLLTNNISITAVDGGSTGASVRIAGSTSVVARTILDRQTTNSSTSLGLSMTVASYFDVSDLVIQRANTGVQLDRSNGSRFRDLLIRDGGAAGLYLFQSAGNRFERCVVTRMQGRGLSAVNGSTNTFLNGVIWSNTMDAVQVLGGGPIVVSNSVLHASASTNLCYNLATNSLVYGDFNDLYTENGAKYGVDFGLGVMEGLPQWTAARGQDTHSVSLDPLFACPTGDDYHVRSQTGRFDPLTRNHVTNDAETSYLIDTADPNAGYTNEPAPNGARLNIGLYGNTEEESKSRTNAWLFAITADAGGRCEGIFYLIWAGGGMADSNTVKLQYSFDDGGTWTNIATGLPLKPGEYLWNSAQQVGTNYIWPSSPNARWKVVLEADTNVYDITRTYFALRNSAFTYYINDAFTNHDVYTTAIGNDTNVGLFAWSPKATLQGLLDSLDVERDDIILIDTGIYPISNTFGTITVADEGRPDQPVYIVGSTNVYGSVLDRTTHGLPMNIMVMGGNYFVMTNLVFSGGHLVIGGSYIELRNLTFTNGDLTAGGAPNSVYALNMQGVSLEGGDLLLGGVNDSTFGRVRIKNGNIVLSDCQNVVLENALVFGSASNAVTVWGNQAGNSTIRNCTLAAEYTQFLHAGPAFATLLNNILVADGSDSFCIRWESGTIGSDYNDFVTRNNAWIGMRNGQWERLVYWQQASGQDSHSFAKEPVFADEVGGDYHLQSSGGRYSGGTWATDTVDSVCVDAGNPLTVYTNEPLPNGGRVNMGFEGNTAEASRTSTNPALVALSFNDGGVARGTNTLRWLSRNIGPGLVRLEYSADNGATWTTIVTDIPSTNQEYSWDSTAFASSLTSRWQVVLQTNTLVNDQTDNPFALRNTPLSFYVNDGSSIGDVFSTGGAVGSPLNSGLASSSPLDSLSRLLGMYEIVGPDTIYVDTGTYDLTNDLNVIWSRRGDAAYGPLLIRGSTNYVMGASLNRGDTNANGIMVYADYVTLRDLIVRQAQRGVVFNTNQYGSALRMVAVSNVYGITARGCQNPTVKNSRFWNNRTGGVDIQSCRTATVENCTFAGNVSFGVRDQGAVDRNTIIQNNIFVQGSNSAAIAGSSDGNSIDYNAYYLPVSSAYLFGSYRDLKAWQLASGHDFRSAITNPLLADVSSGDFHEQSAAGRWVDGSGWTFDGQTSWAVDKGDPDSDYALEPEVNGDRINMGAYGNTEYASKGATDVVVYARTLNAPTQVTETNGTWPLIWTVRNVPPTETFTVQYSGAGPYTTNWVNLATGITAYTEYIIWNTAPYYNTFKGRWRLVGESNTNYWDINDAVFQVFHGDYKISSVYDSAGFKTFIFRGAWDETYQIQYATNKVLQGWIWTNAISGPATNVNQQARFLTSRGGDFTFEDIDSSNSTFRIYRVFRE